MITREDIISGLLAEWQAPESFRDMYKDLSNEDIVNAYARLGIRLEIVGSGLFLIRSNINKHYCVK